MNQVRKIRWPRYASCGHFVTTGQVIVRKDGMWICRSCAIDAIKTTTITEGETR